MSTIEFKTEVSSETQLLLQQFEYLKKQRINHIQSISKKNNLTNGDLNLNTSEIQNSMKNSKLEQSFLKSHEKIIQQVQKTILNEKKQRIIKQKALTQKPQPKDLINQSLKFRKQQTLISTQSQKQVKEKNTTQIQRVYVERQEVKNQKQHKQNLKLNQEDIYQHENLQAPQQQSKSENSKEIYIDKHRTHKNTLYYQDLYNFIIQCKKDKSMEHPGLVQNQPINLNYYDKKENLNESNQKNEQIYNLYEQFQNKMQSPKQQNQIIKEDDSNQQEILNINDELILESQDQVQNQVNAISDFDQIDQFVQLKQSQNSMSENTPKDLIRSQERLTFQNIEFFNQSKEIIKKDGFLSPISNQKSLVSKSQSEQKIEPENNQDLLLELEDIQDNEQIKFSDEIRMKNTQYFTSNDKKQDQRSLIFSKKKQKIIDEIINIDSLIQDLTKELSNKNFQKYNIQEPSYKKKEVFKKINNAYTPQKDRQQLIKKNKSDINDFEEFSERNDNWLKKKLEKQQLRQVTFLFSKAQLNKSQKNVVLTLKSISKYKNRRIKIKCI